MPIREWAPKGEHKARITRALLKLAGARREELSPLDFEVYGDGMREFSAELVERICEDFAMVAPEEYQPRFPPLYQLRERALKALEIQWEQRRLKAAELADQYPPLEPEKFEAIKQRFRDVLARKAMP